MKTCRECKIEKPLDLFSKDSQRKDGLQTSCKSCKKISAKLWNEKNKDYGKLRYKEYYKKNREEILKKGKERILKDPAKKNNARLKFLYGISLETYNNMLEAQNGVCAICEKIDTFIDSRTNKPRNLSVDHCHKTGEVRGLLCSVCNTSIGKFNHDPNLLTKAAKYVARKDK